MADLVEIKAKLVATEGKLTLAENSGNEAMILMYGNNLAELRREKNNLEAGTADPRNADQGNSGLQLQPPQNSLDYVGKFWTFTPHSGPLRHSNYSPMSYSPSTKASLQESSEDTSYYYDLITSALKWITHFDEPHNKYHSKLTGGVFTVSKGVIVVVTVRGVITALQLSNIYHMLKALQGDLPEWIRFLRKNGVPTLVQAIHTGNTPPIDATHYELD
eukprot:gene44486-55332_t